LSGYGLGPGARGWRKMTERPRFGMNDRVGKRLLTVREAAAYLGLQVDTVYKKARLRELPSAKVGRSLRFDVMELRFNAGIDDWSRSRVSRPAQRYGTSTCCIT
jgi:excisionase family DNA binding protein